jgi:hypothetical protein
MKFCKVVLFIVMGSIPWGLLVAQDTQRTLTNADVVNMTNSGIGEQTIVLMIQKSQTKFDTSPEAVIELKKAGVADSVLNAMLSTSSATNSPEQANHEMCTQLFDKALDAVGSHENVAAVKSTRWVGTSVTVGTSGTASYQIERVTVLPGSIYMSAQSSAGLSKKFVITPEFSYVTSGNMTNALPASTLDEYRLSLKIEQIYVAQHRDDYTCVAEGSEQIMGLTTAKLKISGEGVEGYWNVDPATGRLSRIAYSTGASAQTVTDLSDWRIVDGIYVAFKRHVVNGTGTIDVSISEYQVNPVTDAKLFEPPAQQLATTFTFKVLQSESVPYVVETGGGISTNCQIGGSTTTSMSTQTYGNITSGTATSTPDLRMNCQSFDNTVRWPHVLNAMFIEASDGNVYIIACDRSWRWSKCTGLKPGDIFNAQRTDKGFVVQFLNTKGKEKEATYSVLQSRVLH